jgi:hypothetical protein
MSRALVLTFVALLISSCGGEDGRGSAATTTSVSTVKAPASAAELDTFLRERFEAFRRPREKRDRLPGYLQRASDSAIAARTVRARDVADGHGNHAWLVPRGRDTVCDDTRGGSGSCGPAVGLAEGKRVGAAACAGTAKHPAVLIFGFISDGVKAIEVLTRSGKSTSVAVGENFWSAAFPVTDVAALPATVRWQEAKGAERTARLPVDDSFATSPC